MARSLLCCALRNNRLYLAKTVSKAALHVTRSEVNRWFVVQGIVTVAIALVSAVVEDLTFAQSLLLGGLLCFAPQWLFARLWLAYYRASAAPRLVKMFYIGEVLKLCLTAALFILTLAYVPVNVLACLVGFIVAQVAFWLAPLLTSMKKLPIP